MTDTPDGPVRRLAEDFQKVVTRYSEQATKAGGAFVEIQNTLLFATAGIRGSELMPDGTQGWDAYAPFYDWENARTLGRRDVAFWRRLADEAGGPVLELGCGTGRVLVPVARAGVPVVGVDLSAPMLDRARRRIRCARGIRAALVQRTSDSSRSQSASRSSSRRTASCNR